MKGILKWMFVVPFGVSFIIMGIAFIYMSTKKQSDLLAIQSSKLVSAKDLKKLCRSAREELGTAGAFKCFTKESGVVKCENPIKSELTGKPCVYYEMRVSEQFEEMVDQTDSEGHTQRVKRENEKVVASNSQSVNFDVEDATGRITVNFNRGA